jgi:hypothetical protein
MYYSPQSLKQPQLKSSELVILKSLALGLGCDTIKNLLELSEEEFEKKLNSLYTKLQVCNSYTAVGVAFKKGILREKEFTSEKIKSIVLEFATENVSRFAPEVEKNNKQLWALYDFLLDFLSYVDDQNRKNSLQ